MGAATRAMLEHGIRVPDAEATTESVDELLRLAGALP